MLCCLMLCYVESCCVAVLSCMVCGVCGVLCSFLPFFAPAVCYKDEDPISESIWENTHPVNLAAPANASETTPLPSEGDHL